MNVSITEVATTIRTRIACGWTESVDMLKSSAYNRFLKPANLPSPAVVRAASVFFQHALGCFHGCNNDHRHGADQPGNKKILEHGQNIMDHEVHDCHCIPANPWN